MPTTSLAEMYDELRELVVAGRITTREEERARTALDLWRPEGGTPFWKLREGIRAKYGIYPTLPQNMPYRSEWRDAKSAENVLYVHPSVKQANMVAFIKDADHGERDVQSIMKVGKFMQKYSMLSADQINHFANWYTQYRKAEMAKAVPVPEGEEPDNTLLITRNPEKIYHIYMTCSTGSCMSHPHQKWNLTPDKVYTPDDPEMLASERALVQFLDRSEFVHPVHMYAFSPELAVAYYRDEGRIVSRAVLNVPRGTYTRVYGNLHLNEMLEDEGFSRGLISGFRMPILKTDTNVLVSPYIDGEDTPFGRVNFKRGIIEVPDDGDGAEWSMRNYSSGGIPAHTGYVCKACTELTTSNHTPLILTDLLGMHTGENLCGSCIKPQLELRVENYAPAWSYNEATDEWLLDFFPKEQVIDTPNLMLNSDRCSPSSHYVSVRALRMQETLVRYSIYSHGLFDCKRVHLDSFRHLVNDEYFPDTKCFPHDMTTAVLPNGEGALTCAETTEITGHAGQIVKQKLGTNVIISSLWDQYDGLDLVAIKLSGRRTTYTLADHCVMAIINEEKETKLMPRSQCYYSMHTKEWYERSFVRRACKPQRMERTLIHEDFMEHPREMLEAMRVVANVKLAGLVAFELLRDHPESPRYNALWDANQTFQGDKRVVQTTSLV